MTGSSTSHPRLHPTLQAALGTLDMTIESEIALFRRYQTLATLPDPETDEEAGEPQCLPQAAEKAITEPASTETLTSDSSLNLDNFDSEQVVLESHLVSTDEDLTPSELALFQVNTNTETTQKASTDNLEQHEAVLESISPPSVDQGDTIEGAPLSTEAEEENLHASNLDLAIEDYLDSSTALRQHLEDSSTESDPPSKPSKFTFNRLVLLLGLGLLGTLAIILVLSASGLRKKIWPPNRPQPGQTQSSASTIEPGMSAPSPTASSGDTSADIVATDGPDLSKKEFSDVSLDNLSRLQPKSSSTPALSSALASGSPTLLPQATASQDLAPILKDQKSQTKMFYVVLPYNNPVSLQQAQQLVPTAFLISSVGEGQQIQMGALENLTAAQQLGKQLRTKGFSAAIIAPN